MDFYYLISLLLKGCSDLFGDAHFSLSKSNLQHYRQSFHTFSPLTMKNWVFLWCGSSYIYKVNKDTIDKLMACETASAVPD